MTKGGKTPNKRKKHRVTRPIPSLVYPKLMTCCVCKSLAQMYCEIKNIRTVLMNKSILAELYQSKAQNEREETTSKDSPPHCVALSTEEDSNHTGEESK